MKSFLTILFSAIFALLSGRGVDDLDRVSFSGRVVDTAGNVVVGARIVGVRLGTGSELMVASDERGEYRLGHLPPGRYQVRAEAPGFATVASPYFETVAGETIRYDFTLGPGRIVEVLQVDGGRESTRIDTARMVTGATIDRAGIVNLPVESRNVLDLVHLLPATALPGLSDHELAEGDRQVGYRKTPEESGIFSLAGGTPYSNNVTIEGMDNNDDRAGRERFIPVQAGIEEVQVIVNQFSAEYGRAAGGRVNLRLREGEERMHGELSGYYRDARLNANGFFRNADPRRGARLPFFNLNPGVALGGPLGRWNERRSHFFVAYEYDYVDDRAEIAALVPVARNPRFELPQPNGAEVGGGVGRLDLTVRTPRTSHTWQQRADLELGGRRRIGSLVTLARSSDRRGFPGGRRLEETMRESGRESLSWSISDQWTISEKLFNSLRLQWSGLAPRDAPEAGGRRSPVVLITIDDPRAAMAGDDDRSGTLIAGASTTGGMERRENRWQVQETLTLGHGGHTWRAGFDRQTIDSRYTDLTDRTGTWSFDSPADFLANRPARYVQRFGGGTRVGNRYHGLFGQDDWRVRRGLTVGVGLRWDHESVIDDRDNLGPRLSLALDPTGSGRSVIRVGGGAFHNRAMLRTFDDFQRTSRQLLFDTNQTAGPLLGKLEFPHPLAATDPRVIQAAIDPQEFHRRLAPGLRIPASRQLAIGFDRELGRRARLELNYAHQRGAHLWRESNLNQPRRPDGVENWARYLLGLDLLNLPDPLTGRRPYAGTADLIRFSTSAIPSVTSRENGRSVITYGLNSPSTSNATNGLRTALAAIRQFRDRPELTQVEELQSRGMSRYDGLSIGLNGFGLRLGYTISRTIDDGVVNTSSPLIAGDFRRERSLSLLDSRHRLTLSGHHTVPRWLGGWTLAGILQATSARPFNIGLNGNDRNLDDVGNDRPNFHGEQRGIVWRRPGEPRAPELEDRFSLPMIGTAGNLPRNAGRGPAIQTLNLRFSRTFAMGGKSAIQLLLEAFNPLNATIFSFGAEYVDFTPGRNENFLVPRRTIKPRTMRLGIRLTF
jgi:hypothetical protein